MAVRAVAGLRRAALAVAAILATARCAPAPPVDPSAFFSAAAEPGEARIDSLRTWMASGRMDADIDGRRGLGRMRVLYARPERVRADIELGGAFGLLGSRAILWVDAEAAYWQEGANEPVRVAADEILAPVLGGAVGVRDLELLLFGLARLRARWPAGTRIEVRADGGDVMVRALLPGGMIEEATVSGRPPALRRLERRDAGGRTVLVARFDRMREIGGVLAPARVELKAPVAGNRLLLEWSIQKADQDLPEDARDWPLP